MVIRLNHEDTKKALQEIEVEEGEKAAREQFLACYRRCVPGKLSKLPPIAINDWKDAIDEIEKDL